MKKDLLNKKDIKKLVHSFFEKAKQDKILEHFFNNVNFNEKKHILTMCKFWENALFYSGNYVGNPMQTHMDINSKSALNTNHFSKWIQLFNETVDELFEGENAETIKQKAFNVSTILQIRLFK
jgi:hemoglobin